jgi:hypothetical protein
MAKGTVPRIMWVMLTIFASWTWVMGAMAGEVGEAGMRIDIISDPPPEQIVPGTSLARVTLKASRHGASVQHGHLKMKLLAPKRSEGLLPQSPHLEGSELLQLESDLRDGAFSFQYHFPMRGTYQVELELLPVPGGTSFSPTTLRQDFRVHSDPVHGAWLWLLLSAWFALGGAVGLLFSRRTKTGSKPASAAAIVSISSLCAAFMLSHPALVKADHAMNAPIDFPHGPQVIKGNDGWELVVHPMPVQVQAGETLQLSMLLRKEGVVLAEATEMSLNVYQLAHDKPILRANILAPNGSTSQRLQLFDGAPHSCTVTARPAGGAFARSVALAAVLGVDVSPHPPSMTAKIRLLAIAVGVLGGGMVAGFLLPKMSREAGHG